MTAGGTSWIAAATRRRPSGKQPEMPRVYRSRLAIQQLAHQRWGMVTAFLGVAIAILLMLTQLGFREALLSSAVRVQAALAGQLVIASPQLETIEFPTWLPSWTLDVARSDPEVASVRPLSLSASPIRQLGSGDVRTIRVVGLDPSRPALVGLPGLAAGLPILEVPGRALFDRKSRPSYGPIAERVEQGQVVRVMIPLPGTPQEPEIDVAGLFSLGPSLTSDGMMVVSDRTFSQVSGQPLNRPTIGSILLKPGADPERVAAALRPRLGHAASIYTKRQFMAREEQYWARETPIGFIFNMGLVVGGVIGIVFVYQILHGNIARNLSDYAVLKSMGYPDSFFVLIVLQTAGIVGFVAFGPAVAAAWLLYRVASSATGLAMTLHLGDTLTVFAIVMVMSAIAGMLALRKLRDADPVTLFT